MKNELIRNWVAGDRELGIESRLIEKPAEVKPPVDSTAVFMAVAQYMQSIEKNDGMYFKRSVEGNRVEITGPGISMRLSALIFDEIIDEITGHIATSQPPNQTKQPYEKQKQIEDLDQVERPAQYDAY